ncbi:MAG: hypothetical protein MJY93_06315 [Fibrobacter sp.]|nr:hypothetical protein [Fibrobacter sp.]
MKKIYRLTTPSGTIRELDSRELEIERNRSVEYAGKTLEELGYTIEGPILSLEDSIAQLASWQEFVPDNGSRQAITALLDFKETGETEIIQKNQKELAILLQFIKDCESFVKDVKPELTKILCDCADLVSDSFAFSPGLKYEKCTSFDEFAKMCQECNVSMELACKTLFSSITIKKAAELLNLSAEQLRGKYTFTIKQNQNRIKIL